MEQMLIQQIDRDKQLGRHSIMEICYNIRINNSIANVDNSVTNIDNSINVTGDSNTVTLDKVTTTVDIANNIDKKKIFMKDSLTI